MKYLSMLFILIMPAAFASAQESSYLPNFSNGELSRSEILWGLGYLRWNESLRVQQASVIAEDLANFYGLALSADHQVLFKEWGWSTGVSFGTGRANGGGNSGPVPYARGNQGWTSFGLQAKIFKRLSSRIHLGVSVPLNFRSVSWIETPTGATASSGRNFNVGLLFDASLRVNKLYDFYQSIGVLNSQGSTLWRVGVTFHL